MVVAPTLRAGGNSTGGDRPPGTDVDTADSLIVTHALTKSQKGATEDGTGRGTPLVVTPVRSNGHEGGNGAGIGEAGDPSFTLDTKGDIAAVLEPFDELADPIAANQARTWTREGANNFRMSNVVAVTTPPEAPTTNTLPAKPNAPVAFGGSSAVRRLTPRECERLMAFPDDYTLIPVKRVSRSRLDSPRASEAYVEIDGEVWQLSADGPRYKTLGNSMVTFVMRWLGERIAVVMR